jgi:hypothetical protein
MECSTSEDEVPVGAVDEVKHSEKLAGASRHMLTLPDRILLSQVEDQEGSLPPQHISEVPVPPPLLVR